jgi:hypothetical protein
MSWPWASGARRVVVRTLARGLVRHGVRHRIEVVFEGVQVRGPERTIRSAPGLDLAVSTFAWSFPLNPVSGG